VGQRVDPSGETADDYPSGTDEIAGKTFRLFPSVPRCTAGPDDCHRGRRKRVKPSTDIKDGWTVRNRFQRGRVLRIKPSQRDRADRPKRIEVATTFEFEAGL
jgi:hypothetical protein